ncbi:dirigent protein 22-like [Actinidia eriantha]|uniref:dirigent protein 22-like n=1 Tax=Actinidia eriantha TaxID=165200 RepID=UPI00258CF176|nr:dirigent protein 22-like [Actinidia eriantha]
MATILTKTLFSIFLILTPTFSITTDGIFSDQFAETKSKSHKHKMTHLHFYFHDIVSGKNPTAIRIAGPKNAFGTTVMTDDPLTEGLEPGSKVVGRAQGIYALASQHDSGLLMVMNFAFVEGRFNGSALSILGRNRVLDPVREMPVIGGSGIFRFVRGYALARTITYNQKTGDAVVEYNVFVMHP